MEKKQYELELEIAVEERKIKNIKNRIKSLQRTIEKKKDLIKTYRVLLKAKKASSK